jgi:hypothetical protein
MSRCLLLTVLVACSSAGTAPNPSPVDGWLDRWTVARRCLVADADDTLTGVTVAFLLGRTCDSELHDAMQPTSFAALAPASRLVDAVWQQPSVPAKRAAAIDAVDKLAKQLGRAMPVSNKTLRVLDPKHAIEREYGTQFSGGAIRVFSEDKEVLITAFGEQKEYERDRGQRVPDPSTKHLANLVAGSQRMIVWSIKDADHAYEIDSSSDGEHWTTVPSPKGSYVSHWQDPRTRAIEIQVRDELGRLAVHRITPQQPTPVVRLSDYPAQGFSDCTNGGQHWRLGEVSVARFAEKPLRLTSSTRWGQIDCRASTVLVTSHWPDALERCRDKCEPVFRSPNNLEGRGALLEDGRWIYAVVLDQVVGVWTERSEPVFYRLAKPRALTAIGVLGGKPVLILDAGAKYEIVALEGTAILAVR